MSVGPVHEIAIRQVKPGRGEAFRERRAAFVGLLKRQPGVGADREFESFRARPAPDEGEVFIGMTTYESLKANAKIQQKPTILFRFLRFAMTMRLKAYVYVQPVEGPPFDLATLAADPGQVLEIAVRRIPDPAAFDAARKAFINLLTDQPGVSDSWEFAVVKGKKADGLAVGMTVYDSADALASASRALEDDPTTAAYFATFEPVAIQYATSTSNG